MAKSKDINDRIRASVYANFRANPTSSDLNRVVDIHNSNVRFAQASKTLRFYQSAKQGPVHMSTDNSSSTGHYEEPMNDHDLPHATRASYGTSVPAYAVPDTTPHVIHHHHHDSGIPWWMVCWMLSGRNNGYAPAQPQPQRQEERRDSNFGAWMGTIIIAAIVTGPAIAGAFYLCSELVHNIERLYYNEGNLQAGLGFANIVTSLGIGTLLTNAVLSTAIKAMCVSAGFANPMSWAFFILTCVALFAAACFHYAIQEGIYRTTAHYNKDELNPEDPGRFRVTDEQLADLKRADKANLNIKLDNVQNVITAIHHDMTDNPSRTTRIFRYSPFFRSTEIGKELQAIRDLRTTGKVNYKTEVEIGEEGSTHFETLEFNTKPSLF